SAGGDPSSAWCGYSSRIVCNGAELAISLIAEPRPTPSASIPITAIAIACGEGIQDQPSSPSFDFGTWAEPAAPGPLPFVADAPTVPATGPGSSPRRCPQFRQ